MRSKGESAEESLKKSIVYFLRNHFDSFTDVEWKADGPPPTFDGQKLAMLGPW